MLTAMGDVMRRAYEKGWITTRDGNISVRRSGKSTLYITPSGWRKTIIHPEHIIKIKMKGSELLVPNGALPSGELEMHHKLQLLNRNKTQAIVHLHPTNIIAAMHAGWDLHEMVKPFPEVYRYTRVGHNVPSVPPLSQELALQTKTQLGVEKNVRRFDIVGQVSHGVTAVGDNPWDAFEHIERVEHIAQIVLASGVKPDLSGADKRWWQS